MGSLAFAAGGALAGAGQGLAEVGKMSMEQQRMEAMMRMKEDYDSQSQQKGFEQQNKQQQAGFGETEKMHGIEHGEAVEAATATRKFEEGKQEKEIASKEGIAKGHDTARVDAAAISGYSRSQSKNGAGGIKPFQYQKLSTTPKGADGKPIPGALPEQTGVQFDPNTNIAWVQHGDKFLRADEHGSPVRDPKTLNRVPATPGEISALNANPYAKVPSGYKNGGMTYMEAFEAEHGYVPASVQATVHQLAQQSAQQNQSQQNGFKLPSGRVFNPGPNFQGGGAGGAGGDDNDEDVPDAQDTAPAKEPGT
jgi:hypothetical protein